jgi:cell division protease FtsH
VRAILEAAHDEAYQALNLNRKVLDRMAKELMERETLNAEEIAVIFKDVRKLPKRAQWLSSKKRPVSKIGPIAIPTKNSSASKRKAFDAAAAEAAAPKKRKSVTKSAAKPAAKPAGKTSNAKTSTRKKSNDK